MGKKFAGGSGAALSTLEPNNRMSLIPADEMLTTDEDFVLNEFTCKSCLRPKSVNYALPQETWHHLECSTSRIINWTVTLCNKSVLNIP